MSKVLGTVSNLGWYEFERPDSTYVCPRCGPSGGVRVVRHPLRVEGSPSKDWVCVSCDKIVGGNVWRKEVTSHWIKNLF